MFRMKSGLVLRKIHWIMDFIQLLSRYVVYLSKSNVFLAYDLYFLVRKCIVKLSLLLSIYIYGNVLQIMPLCLSEDIEKVNDQGVETFRICAFSEHHAPVLYK